MKQFGLALALAMMSLSKPSPRAVKGSNPKPPKHAPGKIIQRKSP